MLSVLAEEMSSDGESESDKKESFIWKLDTIPTELFLHICSFLSAKFLINVLSKVCVQFKELIDSDLNWRVRIYDRWSKRYPVITCPENFDWKEACLSREVQYHLWSNDAENMKSYCIKGAHYAAVDAVLVIEDGRYCVSSARDKSWKLWNLHNLNEQEPNLNTDRNYESCLVSSWNSAHEGWIWTLAYDNFNHTLYTGSFDNTVNGWMIDIPPTKTSSYRFVSPILCLSYHANVLSCGTYNSKVYFSDPRMGNSFTLIYRHPEKKPVLCMASDEKYIITGSEDGTVIVYDMAAAKILKTVKLENFPLCLSYEHGSVVAGDVKGHLHYIDIINGNFELVKTYESGHEMKITAVQHSLGSVITSSTDKTIHILEPTVDPKPITVLKCGSEVAGLSSYETTLISANTDDTISVWLPKED